jgi:Tol biopolymer transport system component
MGRTPKAAWALFACCALLQLLAPHRSLAQGDHRLVWRSIHSPHFDVHYHEPLGNAARILLARAETANDNIERSLGLSLSQRVAIVLADDDDAANGFATPLPYNSIWLRAVAPEDMSPLADYDDWYFTLLTHEHTHIVHLEEASGLPRLLQHVFGRFYTPQQRLPGWLIEGLAVVEESAHTSGGRVRSSQFEMYLRTDALQDRFLGLDFVTFDGEPWPHGNVRYAYGAAFLQFIAHRYGTQALGRFAAEYGRRIVPYGVNRALKRATGETFVALYAAFRGSVLARAHAVQAQVQRRGIVEGRRVTRHGELTRTPRFLTNDQVAYYVADARHVPELRTLSLSSSAVQRVARVAGTAHVARIPGRDLLLYSAIDYHRGRYAFQELFTVNRSEGRPTRLTRGLRAREPDVSPDGQRIAYVTHGAGTSHLELASLADVEHTRKIVVRSRAQEQVFTPRFSPDGKRLAYSAWMRGGYRDIWLLDLESGRRTRLTYDRAIDRGPVFSPDGNTLYFSSDRSGIANLYAYRFDTGSMSQITNVMSGAFQPDVSPDGKTLLYVGYTAKGFDLYALSLAEASPSPALPSFQREPLAALPEPVATASESYRPYATLYPRAYELSSDEVGTGRRVVLTTSGADAVGFHAFSLRFAQDVNENERAVDLAYTYQRPRFPVFLRGGIQRGKRGGLVVNDQQLTWDARSLQLAVGASFSFPRSLRGLSLRTEYGIGHVDALEPFAFGVDPNYPPPTIPRPGYDARISAAVTHASAQSQPFDISRSWGHVISLWASLSEPYLGGYVRAISLGGRAEQYLRFDFRESVLALAYTAAWNTSVSLGGYPAQVAPVLDSLIGGKGAPGDYARLRGFPVRYGDQLHVAQAEYRLLLVRINRGIETLPVFARRVHAALFADAGDAFWGAFDVTRLGVGVGAELRLDWAAQYGNNYMLRAGLARGVTRGGVWQWYTTLAFPF